MSADELIREALRGAAPQPTVTDPGALQADLAARIADAAAGSAGGGAGGAAGGTAGGFGGGATVWATVATVAIGAGLGTWLGVSGGDAGGADATHPGSVPQSVTAYACPGEGESGGFVLGDRVYAVGQSDDGAWLVVRDVRAGLADVFVRADAVILDEAAGDLPVVECGDAGTIAAAAPQPSRTPKPHKTKKPDPEPTETTTKDPGPKPDTKKPVLSGPSSNHAEVVEDYPGACPGEPRTANVSVTATDNVGVASVTMKYKASGAAQVTRNMSKSGNVWSATFGSFAYPSVPDGATQAVTITFTATDTSGNVQTSTFAVNVKSAGSPSCFG